MNQLTFNNDHPLAALIRGTGPGGTRVPMRVDGMGRPVLTVNGTQTIAANGLDIRSLSAARDAVTATATDFDIRSLSAAQDGVLQYANGYYVTSGSATLVLGGTTVLTVDTAAYSSSAFVVRVDSLSLLTAANLQLAPANISSYYTTDSTQSGLLLGGLYLFVPSVSMRYMRIFATGIGSQLTAYYVGQI